MMMAILKKNDKKLMYDLCAGRSFSSLIQGLISPCLVKPISQGYPWKLSPSEDLNCSGYAHV